LLNWGLTPIVWLSQSTGKGLKAARVACLGLACCYILLYHEASRYFMMVMTMTTATREKFSSQAAPEVLHALRNIAENQGRQFQAVLDDALRDYIDRQQKESPRRHVMTAFASSLDEFDHLYRELAK
jgi:protein-disulfide isomerase-like protein with CxxC motif